MQLIARPTPPSQQIAGTDDAVRNCFAFSPGGHVRFERAGRGDRAEEARLGFTPYPLHLSAMYSLGPRGTGALRL